MVRASGYVDAEIMELVYAERIPVDERCARCFGSGKETSGCAYTHPIYEKCSFCGGTGWSSQKQLTQLFQVLNPIVEKYPDRPSVFHLFDFARRVELNGTSSFSVLHITVKASDLARELPRKEVKKLNQWVNSSGEALKERWKSS